MTAAEIELLKKSCGIDTLIERVAERGVQRSATLILYSRCRSNGP